MSYPEAMLAQFGCDTVNFGRYLFEHPWPGVIIIVVHCNDPRLMYVKMLWISVQYLCHTHKKPRFRGLFVICFVLIQASCHNGFLDIANRLGDLDFAWAGNRAVKNRVAAINAKLVVENRQALGGSPVAAVEDEAVRVHDGRRADIFFVCPEGWAGSGAAGAQDALGGVIETLAFFLGFVGVLALGGCSSLTK